jgi:two-component system nitrogen regulation response regulator NtrX
VRSALPQGLSASPISGGSSGPLAERVQHFERETILAELKRNNYHVTNAAKALGLERSHLYKKAEQLGIEIQKQRREE